MVYIEDLIADLRYGVRILRQDRVVTGVAVLSMALAIGANTALFSVAKTVLFQKVGASHPEQLRLLSWQFAGARQPIPSISGDFFQLPNGSSGSTSFSYPVFQRLANQTDFFDGIGGFSGGHSVTAVFDHEATVLGTEIVSGNFFQVLGAKTVLGRPIQPSDARDNSPAVAVLSYDVWVSRFAQSPAVIGKVMLVNGVPVTVIGVLSPSSFGPRLGGGEGIFLPANLKGRIDPTIKVDPMRDGRSWWTLLVGRLKPGVSDARAAAALNAVLQQAAQETLPNHGGKADLHKLTLHAGSLSGSDHILRSQLAGPVSVLVSLVSLLLLLACTNVANLLVAKSAVRSREMGIRKALGAGRWRIVRQMLTESLLLASLSGIAGLFLAFALRRLLPSILEVPQPPAFDFGVLAFIVTMTFGTGVLFGLAPAVQMFRQQPVGLNESSRMTGTLSKARLRQGLVVIEMALSTQLLLGAVLFTRTLSNLLNVPLGFEATRLLVFEARPSPVHYAGPERFALYGRLEERLAGLTGVRSVAVVNDVLLSGDYSGSNFDPDSQPYRDGRRSQNNSVSSAFFATLGIPIRRGRAFDERDTASSPQVGIVNEELVRRYFAQSDPIGQTFNGGIEIVGVAADAVYSSLRKRTEPMFYRPYMQTTRSHFSFYLKTAGDPVPLTSAVRKTIAAIDPDIPVLNFRTQEEEIHESVKEDRLFASLTSGFGILALLLSSIGIYGVMRHSVMRRTNEVGIRLALGAQSGQVLRLLLREGFVLTVMGLAAGLLGSVFLASYVRSLFYAVTPSDPVSLLVAGGVLLGSGLVAAWLPARRAARISPVEALRNE